MDGKILSGPRPPASWTASRSDCRSLLPLTSRATVPLVSHWTANDSRRPKDLKNASPDPRSWRDVEPAEHPGPPNAAGCPSQPGALLNRWVFVQFGSRAVHAPKGQMWT
jgi:hypothetical protein